MTKLAAASLFPIVIWRFDEGRRRYAPAPTTRYGSTRTPTRSATQWDG